MSQDWVTSAGPQEFGGQKLTGTPHLAARGLIRPSHFLSIVVSTILTGQK